MAKEGSLRIFWVSNAPWANTGYGTQANSLLPRMMGLDSVEEIGLFPYYGVAGALTRQRVGIDGITKHYWLDCYPLRGDMWGNDAIQDHALHYGADVVITLMDIWVLADDYGHRGFRWLPYMPIDMEPIPPPVADKMSRAYKPIVYSKFGLKEAQRVGIDVEYIPHGVETKIFKPYRYAKDRRESKEWLKIPADSFLVGCVGANKGYPSRKGFPELFQAFAEFRRRHTDARLYMHSLLTNEHGGAGLVDMAEAYGIRNYITFVDPYLNTIGIDQETLNMVYNAMDVFCLPSMGEGFGIPIIEAQAAGTPVIITNTTSMSELVGPGWAVPAKHRFYTPLKSWQDFADPAAIYEALCAAYDRGKTPEVMQSCRAFALSYDWDRVFSEYWTPFLDGLAAEVLPRTYTRHTAALLPQSPLAS